MKTRQYLLLGLLLTGAACTSGCRQSETQHAKYIFYFIGDGMGFTHVSTAEAYQAYLETGQTGSATLSFTEFPVLGMASTYSASNNITCSSAAGTALACGEKTNNGFLGVRPDSSDTRSIAATLHEAGYRVGIASSVQINHATPAAFYGHSPSRSDYYILAEQLPQSGFEFFGGGGLLDPQGKKGDMPDAYSLIREAGYCIVNGKDAQIPENAERVMLLQEVSRQDEALCSPGERKLGTELTLADVVRKGISFLYGTGKPFFLMAEGGKIDWLAHGNNAKGTLEEVLDFSEAIRAAVDFYREHPDETLIVVTADHETGGFAMGRKGYSVDFGALERIAAEFEGNAKNYESLAERKNAEIEAANREARLGWTTSGHSGANVPVFAIGAGSSAFAGKMDNTDIPKRILRSALGQ